MFRNDLEAPVIRYSISRTDGAATLVIACPHCRQRDRWRRPTSTPSQHYHGGGGPGENPRTYLGHRASHCRQGEGDGYVLTDPDRLVPAVNVDPRPAVTA